MKLNLQKCVFGVTKGKLLGHIVNKDGIKIDTTEIKTITEMPAPETKKEIRGFLRNIQYISRFISQLTTISKPIFKLLRKDANRV